MGQDALNNPRKLSQLTGGLLKVVTVAKALSATADYTADDVLSESATAGTVWTFAAMARENGASGYITKAELMCETTTVAVTHRSILYLFNAAPNCNLNDNSANTAPVYADNSLYQGKIEFPAMSKEGTGMPNSIASPSTVGNLPLAYRCADTADDLLGVLVTLAGITGEKAGDEYAVKLTTELY